MKPATGRVALLVPVLLLALIAPTYAGPLFRAPYLLFETGNNPTSVAVGDLNGDGRADLAVTNSGAYSSDLINTVSILLGNGDGTFGVRADIDVASRPRSVKIADLNGDGRLDLAVVNYRYSDHAGTVSVLLGNGDGTFGARTDFDGGAGLRSLAIGDLNEDGRPDLVTNNTVLLGNGDGTFGDKTDFGTLSDFAVAIGDLNGDGHLDVVTSNGHADFDPEYDLRAAFVRLGNGDGTLGTAAGFGTGYYAYSVAIGDLNGDGRPDLAVGNFGSSPDYNGSVSVLLGTGDGTFGSQRFFDTGNNPSAVAIADLNADGRLDLATSNYGVDPDFDSNTVSVLLGNGDGTFSGTPDLNVGENPGSLVVADLNADGLSDLVTADDISNTVSVLLGNGDGTFGTPNLRVGGGPASVAIADLDADGRADLAVAKHTSSAVSVLMGNGDGTFRAGTEFGTGMGPWSVAISDLNADGRPDLAVANIGSFQNPMGTISVLLGNGDGTFQARNDYAAGPNPGSVAIADLNADGRPDLALANTNYSNKVSVLLGNGDGTFRDRTEFGTGNGPSSLAIADLNADGRPDLVTANAGFPNTVSVLLGGGDGTFWDRSDFDTGFFGNNSQAVAIADLNADGRPDVVAGRSILFGNGDGTLDARIDFANGMAESFAIADFNGDGRLDLAAAFPEFTSASGAVAILLGNGDGTFAPRILLGPGRLPRSLAVADLNADGRQDLAVANFLGSFRDFQGTVSVLLNRGPTPTPLAMGFDFTPGTLNLASHGLWVTGYLEPVPGFTASDIDIASIRLNGTVAVAPSAPTALGDYNENRIMDLMVKFDRAAVELTLSEGDNVQVAVTGTLAGRLFSGTDAVSVRRGRVLAPAAGSHFAAGSVVRVRWETPGDVTVESVAMLFSADGGDTWSTIVRGQPNTGSYDWTVPDLLTDQAKVAVVVNAAGDLIEGVLGVSDAFVIDAAVGLGDRGPMRPGLAIRGAPNPTLNGRLRVVFALPDGAPARLDLIDVTGRVLSTQEVGSRGPGRHSLDLSENRGRPPGIYFLRLIQGGSEARARVVFLR